MPEPIETLTLDESREPRTKSLELMMLRGMFCFVRQSKVPLKPTIYHHHPVLVACSLLCVLQTIENLRAANKARGSKVLEPPENLNESLSYVRERIIISDTSAWARCLTSSHHQRRN